MDWLQQYEEDKRTYQSMCQNCGQPFMYMGPRVQETEQAFRLRKDGLFEHVKCPSGSK